jgi:PAS domain S-box-containing protein
MDGGHIAPYDLPFLCVFFLFVYWIRWFIESRCRAELSLSHVWDRLEIEVQTRTAELTRLNVENETILDEAPFGIALLGPDRIVRRCNREYERMLGFEHGELNGCRAPLPESEKATWKIQEEQLREGQRISDYETARCRKDGSEFSATISATPLFDDRGSYIGLVGLIIDNTDRFALEAKVQMFRSVVQNSPDFIGVADMNSNVVFVNRSGQRMFGLDEDGEVGHTQTLDYFADDQRETVRNELIPLLLERGELTREVPAKNFKTGQTFPALWTAFVIYDQKTKQPSLLASVTKDITGQLEDRVALQKSLKHNEVLLGENEALQEKLRRENISLQELNFALQGELADIQKNKFEQIIGGSPALQRTLIRVAQVASTDATVLITGETGTGKELIAQAIHKNSKRAGMPFRSINCAALPATLMAAELFGHEKGSFTGADRQRVGQFELAAGGTLFLDEIAEIPTDMQATLLRVLEERTFRASGRHEANPSRCARHRRNQSRSSGGHARWRVSSRPLLPAQRLSY